MSIYTSLGFSRVKTLDPVLGGLYCCAREHMNVPSGRCHRLHYIGWWARVYKAGGLRVQVGYTHGSLSLRITNSIS
jgi:hypothetical protein